MKWAVVVLLLTVLVAAPSTAERPGVEKGATSFDAYAERERGAFEQPGTSADSASESEPALANPVVDVSYRLVCGDDDANLRVDTLCDTSLFRCGVDNGGLTYFTTSTYEDGSRVQDTGCFDPEAVETAAAAPAAPPRITPGLVLRAFERVPLPESELVVQPPGGQTLVGLDTIFSTEAEGFTETVRLLGRSVELDITPSSYRWSHGDRTTQTTDWPGQAWRRSGDRYITHVYDDRMRVTTSVDTTWTARYRVDGGAWQQVPGTVTIEGDPAALRVRSASPHLVGVNDSR